MADAAAAAAAATTDPQQVHESSITLVIDAAITERMWLQNVTSQADVIVMQAGRIDQMTKQVKDLKAEIERLKVHAIAQRADIDKYRSAGPKDVPAYVSLHSRVREHISLAYDEADAENKLLRAKIIELQEQLVHHERERGPGHC